MDFASSNLKRRIFITWNNINNGSLHAHLGITWLEQSTPIKICPNKLTCFHDNANHLLSIVL